MKVLTERVNKEQLIHIEDEVFFEEMMKCVVDIEKKVIAVNAELHADLEQFLLEQGSGQDNLYGINILYDEWEIEFDSMINPPRNRAAGFPRAGRDVADPKAREIITEVVHQWIEM